MTNPSGVEKNHGSVSAYNATPTRSLLFNQGISADWTQEEQAILEEGLIQYASEPVINRYAKIGLLLENKTIRDVALRCTWMRTKENNKKRKEELGVARRNKEIKVTMEKAISPSATPSFIASHQGFAACTQGLHTNKIDVGISYNGVAGPVRHLLQQNAQAFNQISMNIATQHMQENIGLLFRTRDNIYKILSSLDEMPNMKQMHPLPITLNEELASSILPRSALQMK
ncbi:hypothetical protein LIER_15829 [Lithospermum erythrorhizon]|uniref:Myb-like domain-containing protein n=1 Tax=Lithospermum erythrorhizon TaxID=34254 RepID=A0AAV3Q6T3_LITER